jgi:hypothetical protein
VDSTGGNILGNPLFADYPSRDLHLQPSSPAVDAGLPSWSAAVDFAGVSRPRGIRPDIGAFER